jgi:hypothetical protein
MVALFRRAGCQVALPFPTTTPDWVTWYCVGPTDPGYLRYVLDKLRVSLVSGCICEAQDPFRSATVQCRSVARFLQSPQPHNPLQLAYAPSRL